MRKCVRCGVDMIENLESGLKLKRTPNFRVVEVDLKAAMCPKCGCTELYTDELSVIEKVGGPVVMDK
jgi:predicted nucleic-acid-binding Zn-ribbon protein